MYTHSNVSWNLHIRIRYQERDRTEGAVAWLAQSPAVGCHAPWQLLHSITAPRCRAGPELTSENTCIYQYSRQFFCPQAIFLLESGKKPENQENPRADCEGRAATHRGSGPDNEKTRKEGRWSRIHFMRRTGPAGPQLLSGVGRSPQPPDTIGPANEKRPAPFGTGPLFSSHDLEIGRVQITAMNCYGQRTSSSHASIRLA